MKVAILIACLAVGAMALPRHEQTHQDYLKFQEFKNTHNKVYANKAEEKMRFGIFQSNLRRIEEHNRKGLSYTLGVTKFSDMTNAEFQRFNGFRASATSPKPTGTHFNNNVADLPATVDWRTKGAVVGVKDQGGCGSCWAFSAVASTEGQHFLSTGKLVSLSEQNLVDCSGAEGNQGCGGGLMDQAFQYVIDNKGIDTEASYPYEGEDDTCRFKKANIGATLTGFKDIPTGDEKALQNAVATVGPISVAIDASAFEFSSYTGGIYNYTDCGNDRGSLDHGVTAVGYGTESGQDYWLIKNSWGTTWGISGYIKLARNQNNLCGVATLASYPTGVMSA